MSRNLSMETDNSVNGCTSNNAGVATLGKNFRALQSGSDRHPATAREGGRGEFGREMDRDRNIDEYENRKDFSGFSDLEDERDFSGWGLTKDLNDLDLGDIKDFNGFNIQRKLGKLSGD